MHAAGPAQSPPLPQIPRHWAHFWEAHTIIFRETQFPELGPQPTRTSVSPPRSLRGSGSAPGLVVRTPRISAGARAERGPRKPSSAPVAAAGTNAKGEPAAPR